MNTAQEKNPGDCSAGASKERPPQQQNKARLARKTIWLEVTWQPHQTPQRFNGREAQTLSALMKAGPIGLTSGEFSSFGWARRTSAYVHKLRAAGLDISTTYEVVSPDATVGRYRLLSPMVGISSSGLN